MRQLRTPTPCPHKPDQGRPEHGEEARGARGPVTFLIHTAWEEAVEALMGKPAPEGPLPHHYPNALVGPRVPVEGLPAPRLGVMYVATWPLGYGILPSTTGPTFGQAHVYADWSSSPGSSSRGPSYFLSTATEAMSNNPVPGTSGPSPCTSSPLPRLALKTPFSETAARPEDSRPAPSPS